MIKQLIILAMLIAILFISYNKFAAETMRDFFRSKKDKTHFHGEATPIEDILYNK